MINYEYFEPASIEEGRKIYEIFKKIGRSGNTKGLIINRDGSTSCNMLYIPPMPNEIGQAVVAYNGEEPVGVICCNRPKIKKLVSNTTRVVDNNFRGLKIGRGLERELMSHIPVDFKITAYAGSSAARFHSRDKSTWKMKFRFTSRGSLMVDIYHRNNDAEEHFVPSENELFSDCQSIFESPEVEEVVNKLVTDKDEKFDELRREVFQAKSFELN